MLCKCSGKYIDIYFNLKITFLPYLLLAIPMPFFANSACLFTSLSLSSSVAAFRQCQSAYSSCSFLVSFLALGVRAAAHLLWWFLFSLLYCALLL